MKVVVGKSRPIHSTISPTNTVTATSVGIQGPAGPSGAPGPNSISGASDIDMTNVQDGALLIYNANTSKFAADINLESQIIEGGHF